MAARATRHPRSRRRVYGAIVPIGFMRGRTFVDSCIIVDEAQNVTDEQLEMILSRLGKGSKMILCGDEAQNDFKRKKDSGFNELLEMVGKINQLDSVHLKTNHRHGIVDEILTEYIRIREEKETVVMNQIHTKQKTLRAPLGSH